MRYTLLPGRWIAVDGTPAFAIMLTDRQSGNWETFGPTEADRMARKIVDLLNGENRDALA